MTHSPHEAATAAAGEGLAELHCHGLLLCTRRRAWQYSSAGASAPSSWDIGSMMPHLSLCRGAVPWLGLGLPLLGPIYSVERKCKRVLSIMARACSTRQQCKLCACLQEPGSGVRLENLSSPKLTARVASCEVRCNRRFCWCFFGSEVPKELRAKRHRNHRRTKEVW